MSKEEIKTEINKVLDTLPDKALEDLPSFLKSIGGKESISLPDKTTIGKILSEDKELLAKLAK